MERVVIVADHQIPYQNKLASKLALNYIRDTQPDMVIVLGDMLDFPYLTTKFLRRNASPDQILKDISHAEQLLESYRGNTKRLVFIEGNHEARLANYILECAPALEGLTEAGQPLNLETMLGVSGLEYIGPYGEAFVHKSVVFKHGDAASTYAAFNELRDEGSSGVSGHTHRMQVASRTDRKGAHAWYSIPALCNVKGRDMPPGYRHGNNRVRNQQIGFAVAYFSASIFNIYPIIITGNKFLFEGKLYEV